MYGTFNFDKVSTAASVSLYAGPPTRENPVRETRVSIDEPELSAKYLSIAGLPSKPPAKAGIMRIFLSSKPLITLS